MGDVRGYYAALGVHPTDTVAVVKAAYRRLAKECHPDRGNVTDGGARFHILTEAYEVLSNTESRLQYDRLAQENPPTEREQTLVELILCDACGKVAAQPRRILFWRVTSFILVTNRTPVQKIYCNKCAAGEEWKSTLWTGLLGWWGVPWGPVWSIVHGAKNALGGTRELEVDEALCWQNAVAFATRGQLNIAVALANVIRKSDNVERAQRATDLIQFCGGRGADTNSSLKDVWRRPVGRTIGLLIAAYILPGTALAYVLASTSGPGGSTTGSPYEYYEPASTSASTSASAPTNEIATADEVIEPITLCQNLPENGAILTDERETSTDGHVLIIDNGTAGDAIVKVRDALTGKTLVSYFVSNGSKAALEQIPDGTYEIQYAIGKLGEDCSRFGELQSANKFPGPNTMTTTYEPVLGGTNVVTQSLSYTLYSTPGGNVRPSTINAAEFNR